MLNNVPYVPACLRAIFSYVVTCRSFTWQRTYVPFFLTCQRTKALYVLTCLRAVLSYVPKLCHAYVPKCLRAIFSYVPTCQSFVLPNVPTFFLTCQSFLRSNVRANHRKNTNLCNFEYSLHLNKKFHVQNDNLYHLCILKLLDHCVMTNPNRTSFKFLDWLGTLL